MTVPANNMLHGTRAPWWWQPTSPEQAGATTCQPPASYRPFPDIGVPWHVAQAQSCLEAHLVAAQQQHASILGTDSNGPTGPSPNRQRLSAAGRNTRTSSVRVRTGCRLAVKATPTNTPSAPSCLTRLRTWTRGGALLTRCCATGPQSEPLARETPARKTPYAKSAKQHGQVASRHGNNVLLTH